MKRRTFLVGAAGALACGCSGTIPVLVQGTAPPGCVNPHWQMTSDGVHAHVADGAAIDDVILFECSEENPAPMITVELYCDGALACTRTVPLQ